jgi:hypothetical protein
MAILAPPPLVKPVHRPFGLLLPPGKQLRRLARAQTAPKRALAPPEEPALGATLASLVVGPLALVAVVLWPLVFAAVVLSLVVLTPFAAVGAGVQGILRHGRRGADSPGAAALGMNRGG